MDLTLSENTFKKNLLEKGLNVSIINYPQLINIIQTKIVFEIINAIKNDNLSEVLVQMYCEYTSPEIKALLKPSEITFVSTEYIVILIQSGYLSSLISETTKKVSESTKINSEKLKLLNILKENFYKDSNYYASDAFGLFLHFIKNKTDFFTFINKKTINISETTFATSAAGYVKAISLTESEKQLSEEDKTAIKNELLKIIEDFKIAINSDGTYNKKRWMHLITESLEKFNTTSLI